MKHLFSCLALLISTSAMAAPIYQNLQASDPFQTVVEETTFRWEEGNISTGTSAASALLLTPALPSTEPAWKQLAAEVFKATFKVRMGEDLPESAHLRLSSSSFSAADVKAAVAAVAEGNAYDTTNPEIIQSLTAEINAMIAAMGDTRDLHFVAVKSRLDDESSGEKRNVRIHAFISKKTSKMLLIFTIEGTL